MKDLFLKIIYRTLAFYAKTVIKRYNPTVIAVTGSVGKTGTKEAIFKILNDAYPNKVRKSEGNLNAEIGLPLSILGYSELPQKFLWPFFLIAASFKLKPKKYPKFLVLEMGVEKPGDIKYLTSIAKPDYAIITSLSGAHLANFKDIKEYQKEKLSIITSVPEGGKIILNADDPVLREIKGKRIISVSTKSKKGDFYADDVKISLAGTEFRICSAGHKIAIKSQLIGSQLINSSLFAFALADLFKISLINAAKSLEGLKRYSGRMNIIEGRNNFYIIDDTYNANPDSVKAAIDTLFNLDYKGRKVLILGNMNELGRGEEQAHREIGLFANRRVDYAVFYGPNAARMQKAFGDEKKSLAYEDRQKLLEEINSLIRENDLVLVKASQNNNFFEEVVKKLMKNPEKADKLLVRQSKFWLRKKHI